MKAPRKPQIPGPGGRVPQAAFVFPLVITEGESAVNAEEEEVVTVRSIEEQKTEIKRLRSFYIERRKVRNLSVTAALMSVALIVITIFAPTVTGNVEVRGAHFFGSTILVPEAGGYVLVAVIAFALGVVIAAILQKYKTLKEIEKNRKADKPDENEQ